MTTMIEQQTSVNHDVIAREYIIELKKGIKPHALPDMGEWNDIVREIEIHFDKCKGNKEQVEFKIKLMYKVHPKLKTLLEDNSNEEDISIISSETPPLPEALKPPLNGSRGACLWHDEYVAFSKWRSPRSFHNFHEGNGWAILSTIALHRVRLDLGSKRYTPLFLASIADSSVSAKTEAAKVFHAVLDKAGLKWTLGPDNTTPQAMIGDMATITGLKADSDYINWSDEEKEIFTRELAFKGQRGWFYEEFGEQMDAMCRANGVMVDFKGIIRRMDDCYDEYSRSTITHKKQIVEYPYLSLIACMTPLDIKVQAGANSPFWRDGFFARFAFITPHENERTRGRFPEGSIYDAIPDTLTAPLQSWNNRLGTREVLIEPQYHEGSNNIKKYTIEYGLFPEKICILSPNAKEAFYRYGDALDDIIEETKIKQFEGNYKRFPMMAMRIAMLCASLENNGYIEMKHWWKGQEFAEMARQGLHELYAQVNISIGQSSGKLTIADKILMYMKEKRKQGITHVAIRDMARGPLQGDDGGKIKNEIDVLVKDGSVIREKIKNEQGRELERYRLP
jgi:hypothetical protein